MELFSAATKETGTVIEPSIALFQFGTEREARRLISKILVTETCWIFTGYVDPKSRYGLFHFRGRLSRPHRVAWVLTHGSLPVKPLVLDHLCRNRRCVNPLHLEVVTFRENVLRGEGKTAANARKTACVNGHEFTPENTYQEKRGRSCRACAAANSQRYRLRKRGHR